MAAGTFAQVHRRIWADDNWSELLPFEQWLYLHFVTHPELYYSGVVKNWAPKHVTLVAAGVSVGEVELALASLEARGYVIYNSMSDEVLVRSFHRNDECLKQTNMGKAVATAYWQVKAPEIRGVIVWELQRLHAEHPDWKGWAGVAEILERPATDPAVYRQEPLPGADAPADADPQEAPF